MTRASYQFDNAKFITTLVRYKESDTHEAEYVYVDNLVNNRVVFVPESPTPDDANLRLYQNRIVMTKIGKPPLRALDVSRGLVSYEFSRKCRRRLMNAFNSWQVPENSKRYMITLTYPSSFPEDYRVWKDHLKTIKRRLSAIFGENIEGYWRLELQKRGAPHYHLLVSLPKGFITNKKLKKLITHEWSKIAHNSDIYGGEYATNVKVLHNDRMAAAYVSKYCAKVSVGVKQKAVSEGTDMAQQFEAESAAFTEEKTKQKTIGRQWGRVGKPNESPIAELNISLQEQHLLRSILIDYLALAGNDYAKKIYRLPDYLSFQVYGISGYALILAWEQLRDRVFAKQVLNS